MKRGGVQVMRLFSALLLLCLLGGCGYRTVAARDPISGANGVNVVMFANKSYRSGVPALQPYTAKINMSWAQELCIFMFVWMAKFGAAYGVRVGTHVGVDLLVNRLPPPYRKAVVTLGLLGGVSFTGLVAWMSAGLVWDISQTDQTSEELEWPMWVVYLCIPLGSSLMCYRFLQAIAKFWRDGAHA